jgi:hypothetical protein
MSDFKIKYPWEILREITDIHSYPTGANIFNPPKTVLILGNSFLSLDIYGANVFTILFILDYPLLSIESNLNILLNGKCNVLNGKRHIPNYGI